MMNQTISRKKAKRIFEENAVVLSKNIDAVLSFGIVLEILGVEAIEQVLAEPMKDELHGYIYWLDRRSQTGKVYKVLTKKGFLKAVAYHNESIVKKML